jgi:deoxyribodipyrimidine photolyase
MQRVQQWIFDDDMLKSYKETRNGLVGAAYSSKFSPWLAFGCVSPRWILQEIKRYVHVQYIMHFNQILTVSIHITTTVLAFVM